jgi:hypothetical protein
MILLRFLSAALGVIVLIGPPMMLFADSRPDFFASSTAIAFCLGLVIVAAAFFFVALAGNQMKNSAFLRTIGASLLAIPFVGSGVMMWRGNDAIQLWSSGLVLCFTILLFVVFVVPGARPRKHRPMRKREPAEPNLIPLRRVQ